MIHLFQEAGAFQRTLDSHHWPFCFIGGIALQHWGEPRVTRDLDVSIFTGFDREAPVVDALLDAYEPRITDARAFALRHRVLLLSTAAGVEVDVALAAIPFERAMIDRSTLVEFQPEIRLRVCSAEDLLVMKAFADRAQDRADVIGIARRRGPFLDWDAILERLAPLAEAKEQPDIVDTVRKLRDSAR